MKRVLLLGLACLPLSGQAVVISSMILLIMACSVMFSQLLAFKLRMGSSCWMHGQGPDITHIGNVAEEF